MHGPEPHVTATGVCSTAFREVRLCGTYQHLQRKLKTKLLLKIMPAFVLPRLRCKCKMFGSAQRTSADRHLLSEEDTMDDDQEVFNHPLHPQISKGGYQRAINVACVLSLLCNCFLGVSNFKAPNVNQGSNGGYGKGNILM